MTLLLERDTPTTLLMQLLQTYGLLVSSAEPIKARAHAIEAVRSQNERGAAENVAKDADALSRKLDQLRKVENHLGPIVVDGFFRPVITQLNQASEAMRLLIAAHDKSTAR